MGSEGKRFFSNEAAVATADSEQEQRSMRNSKNGSRGREGPVQNAPFHPGMGVFPLPICSGTEPVRIVLPAGA